MKRADLKHAIAMAEEFLSRAQDLLDLDDTPDDPAIAWHPSKVGSALRRQSMELTRALAEMRARG